MNKYSLHTLEVLIISKTRTNLKESCNTPKQHTCWLQRAFHALNNLLSRVDNNSCDIFTSLRGRCNEHDIIQENNFSWLGLKSYFTKNTAFPFIQENPMILIYNGNFFFMATAYLEENLPLLKTNHCLVYVSVRVYNHVNLRTKAFPAFTTHFLQPLWVWGVK